MDKHKNYKLIVHVLATVVCVTTFYYITIRTKPIPISDFLYYWDYATNLSMYIKGGLLFLLYGPLKLMGLEPYIAAFVVNSACFIALSYSMWLGGESKWQILSSVSLVLSGVWFMGFIPIVNTDIPTITLCLLGIRFFLDYLNTEKKLFYILSLVSITISLSMRSQLFYISILLILILCIFLIFQHIKKQKSNKSLKLFLLLLITSTMISFIAQNYLESNTSDTVALAVHKRTTFYTGLLETPDRGPTCGGYTAEGARRVLDEINMPLPKALRNGIQKLSISKIVEILACKWSNYIIEYNGSGMTWLEGHITNGWTQTKDYGGYWKSLRYVEYYAVELLKLLSFSLILIFSYNIKRYKRSEIVIFGFTVFTVLMFFGIHTILEIQPRYIIPPVMIALVLSLYLHSRMFKKIA